jgi:hypothetical protein
VRLRTIAAACTGFAVAAGACADLAGIPDRFYGPDDDGGGSEGGLDGAGGADGAHGDAGAGDAPFFPPDAPCPSCLDSGLCLLACKQDHPSSIAIDQSAVYWTNAGDSAASLAGGGVMRVDKSGANLATIVGPIATFPRSVIASDGCIYWLEQSNSGSVRKSCGGAVTDVKTNLGLAIPSVSVAKSRLVWSTASGSSDMIDICTLPACAGSSFVANNRSFPTSVTLDPAATSVTWMESQSGNGAVLQCPVSGCATNPFVIGLMPSTATGVAVDSAGDVFYTSGTSGQSDGQVGMYFAVGGTSSVEARGRPSPRGIAAANDTMDIYWAEVGSGADGQVVGCAVSVPGPCDTIKAYAGNLSYPVAVAVDTTRIYWVNAGPPDTPNAGSVMSAPR